MATGTGNKELIMYNFYQIVLEW